MKAGQLVRYAVVAGPAIARAVKTAGPLLDRLRKDYPEAFDAVQQQVKKLAEARRERSGAAAVRRRIAVLREQVEYLRASADDDAEARRAAGWARVLTDVERLLPVVLAERPRTQRAHLRQIEHRLDELGGDLLAAVIAEREEDAAGGGLERADGAERDGHPGA